MCWRILLAGLAAAIMPLCPAYASESPLSVESRPSGNGHLIIAHNNGPSFVSSIISIHDVQNFSSNKNWPVAAIVPPHSDLTIGSTFPADTSSGYTFKTSWTTRLGLIDAIHSNSTLYRMPYLDGRKFTVTQAPGGPITTHNTPENQYAIDFSMPEGTLILAARDGVVVDIEDSHTEGGTDVRLLTQANDVRILHSDGTIASYAHLMPSGVAVKIGQAVKSGEIIGYSGSTGFSSGPHLHFAVTKLQIVNGELTDVSVPTTFYVGNPSLAFNPKYGMNVTANYLSTITPEQLFQSDTVVYAAPQSVNHSHIGNTVDASNDPSAIRINNTVITNWKPVAGFFLLAVFLFLRGIRREQKRKQQILDDIRHGRGRLHG